MKRRLAVCLLFLLMAAAAVLWPQCGTHLNIGGASSLVVFSGDTGEKITITDAETIRHITDTFDALTLQKKGRLNSGGFTYSLR